MLAPEFLHPERIVALDRAHGRPFDRNAARVCGIDLQKAELQVQDPAGDSVAVLQRDNVGLRSYVAQGSIGPQSEQKKREPAERLQIIPMKEAALSCHPS
jgi:hypothetical protein